MAAQRSAGAMRCRAGGGGRGRAGGGGRFKGAVVRCDGGGRREEEVEAEEIPRAVDFLEWNGCGDDDTSGKARPKPARLNHVPVGRQGSVLCSVSWAR
jgi:hypothetical protein